MKTLAQFEDEVWDEWSKAFESGETDQDYGDFFQDALDAHNDMEEDKWQTF